ncbi:MAG: hypothetical protein M1834_006994 [Cirrosporium novae-zelandiae]|nr:MAG: hypothetical protein M1834_006994 [Cirrosporium novae-zelandiae]
MNKQDVIPEKGKEGAVENGSPGEFEDVNASGHHQELDRNFSLLSVSAVGITTGNTWAALGGSILVSLYNGGAPGVIYEFIAVSVFYWLVAACIAELASAIPSSAGVYHWASVTPGRKYGRVCGFFAGYWNFFAWIFGSASMSAIIGNLTVSMYSLYHPDFVPHAWHVFIAYLVAVWLSCGTVLFANRALPAINNLGLFFILAGCFITIVVCAAMPGHGGRPGHASDAFVWKDWAADIGYSSQVRESQPYAADTL